MQQVHKKNKRFTIMAIIVISSLFIFVNPYNFFSPIRSGLHIIFSPFIEIGYIGGYQSREFLETITSIGSLSQQNQELYKQNITLQSEIDELKSVQVENEILRKQLGILPQKEINLIGAEVIMRDILGNNDWIKINRGRKDGIQKDDMVVVGDKNLVGIVEEVFYDQATVNLITHPNSVINVVTVETGVEAIAQGKYGTSIIVEKINQDAEVEEGMTFITSQISGKFLRGFTVGVVQNIYTTQDGLFKNARITPLVDLENLRFVFVVKEN
jgi:rod shape-determining protein MreC